MASNAHLGRSAGLVVPLFSIRSGRSWGIGGIGDLAPFARWMTSAGFRLLQLLPVNTLGRGETSPYSALSAMAIDPAYVSLPDVHDFAALGGESRLPLSDQMALRTAREASRVQYIAVRQAKESALRLSFSLFWDVDWVRTTPRAGAFAAFASWEDWWLGDYALFCALRGRFEDRSWLDWPAPLRDRDPRALEEARRELDQEILFHQYVQWVADQQWERAREALGPVRLFGDFPFMVSTDSADVWANQHLFRFDATVGTPPDAFSDTGQDWGLPVYRWDRMAAEDDRWLRQRGKRTAHLFDGVRLDHLVGFYRTYFRPAGAAEGTFDPATEAEQTAQGERLMALFRESGLQLTAEDLGSVPDFVRASLARLALPGYKVLRWEREWEQPGQPFRDPALYPRVSVATTGTHDTEPLATWWSEAPADERRGVARLLSNHPAFADVDPAAVPFTAGLRDILLSLLYRSGSDLLLLPMPDLFGWTDRINVPATVGGENWTWRLPLSIEALETDPSALERTEALRAMAEESGRLIPSSPMPLR